MQLAELALKTSYHKGEEDIARDFYLPCMSRAVEYRRAVGFFRSSVFIIAWPALRDFVARGGTIKILCSHVLSSADVAALEAGYGARAQERLGQHLVAEVSSMVEDPELREPTQILAALVIAGVIDFKIAILNRDAPGSAGRRIFHDKVGIFEDAHGDQVLFKGSMNETWYGLASDGNIESVDVAASWMGPRDRERIDREAKYFENLWENRYPGVDVQLFPDVAKDLLEQSAHPDWEAAVEAALLRAEPKPIADHLGRTLRPHQAAGLAAWEANGRRGILAFATGSGKTFTALDAIRRSIRDHGEIVVVVVPDRTLFSQWDKELKSGISDLGVAILRAGAGKTSWREQLPMWTTPGEQRRLVLATLQTAASDDFRNLIDGGPHLMLVADEVHRAGAPRASQILNDATFGPRLGLSATPERAGDPDGTRVLMDFFGGVLEPRYQLADAVRDGVLCKYFYHPHTVRLSPQETADWDEVTARVRTLHARIQSGDSSPGLPDRLRLLLIERARIVKNAEAKIPLAREVLSRTFEPGQRWIVYCEDRIQMEAVTAAIADLGLSPIPYHSAMSGDRVETLRWLERRGGVLTSIRCLDEGVDVPSVTHALILASSKNPREFIQRRGRVLRTSPGKNLAHVHDAIVIPERDADSKSDRVEDPITSGEIARAIEFASHAENPSASAEIELAAIEAGIQWQGLTQVGVEDDERT